MPKSLQCPLICKRIQSRRGFTFVELLIAMTAGAIILAALLSTTIFVSRSFIAIRNYTDLDQESRNALDVMSRDIRAGAYVSSYATNDIVLTNQSNVKFEYKWDGATLVRTTSSLITPSSSTNVTLLKNCDVLSFAIYQRNPTNNFQFVVATDNTQAKLVDMSWRCSRQIYGAKINTESVQTARIVIRNNPF